jgi:hypothetical protein
LEGYAARFQDVFRSLAQQRGFREYLAGLLAPRDRNNGFRGELRAAGLRFVMALKPHRGTWAYGPDAHTETWYAAGTGPRPRRRVRSKPADTGLGGRLAGRRFKAGR